MSFAGLLNTTCTIQKCTYTQNATSREMSESWANDATGVKCRLTGARGGRRDGDRDTVYEATHTLFLEYRTDIDWSTRRIVVGSITYTIVTVIDAGGAGHHTELGLKVTK